MPLMVECTSCGKKYNADESMAGRRIKCRQCGTIFVVPSLSGDDDLNESINALAQMENSQAGESMVHESVAGSYTQPQDQSAAADRGDDSGPPPRRAGAFTYPYAAVVDRWLPILLTVGGVAWLMITSFKFDESGVSWLAALRGGVLLIAYLAILFPLGLRGMQMAGRDTGFALPRATKWIGLATFMPAFVFGAVLWIIGGTITSLIVGVLVGFAFSVGAMFLLFHMDPKDLPAAAGYAGGMFVFGLALAGGILFGLNVLLASVMVSEKMADRLPGSPFAANFNWPQPSPVAPPPMVSKKHPGTPATPTPTPSPTPAVATDQNATSPAAPTTTQTVATVNPADPTAGPTTQPGDRYAIASTPVKKAPLFTDSSTDQASPTSANPQPSDTQTPPTAPAPTNISPPQTVAAAPQTTSPFVASVEMAPIGAKFDEIIRPTTPSQWVGLLRKGGEHGEIDRYWAGAIGSDAAAPTNSTAAAIPAGSTAGTKAWTLNGAAPFASEVTGQQSRYALSADGDLLAHISPYPVLSIAVYSYNKKAQFPMLKLLETDGQADVVGFIGGDRLLVHRSSGTNDGFEIWNARDTKSPRLIKTESFEKTGAPLAISPDGTMLAIAARDQSHGTTPGGAAIFIHDLGQLGVRKLAIADLDPRWNVAPTGLAFSPDNTKLAVLFEQNANGLLVIFHSKTIVKPVSEQVFNPMPVQSKDFSGSSLTWLNEDALLLYGQTVLRTDTGGNIGELGIPNVTSQHFSKPDLCELGFNGPGGDHQIAMLKLKMDEIEKAATAK